MDKAKNVTVSVIIPTHNRPQQLLKAVRSVLKQSFQDFEIIIVDDASRDAIVQNCIEFQDQRIEIIRNDQSEGGSRARNRGIFKSRGRYIAFLDDDDIWQPQKLEEQLKLLHDNPEAIACSAAYTVHYPLNIKRIVCPPETITLTHLLENNTLGGSSVCLCDAQIIKQLGGFNARLRSAQDWDVWVRLRMQGDIVTVTKPLVDYFVHFDARISNNMQAKYQGSRRFYFLYKNIMTKEAKQKNLQFISFIKSRKNENSLRLRLKHLMIAMNRNSYKKKFAYGLSSLPRMLFSLLYVNKSRVKP